MEESNEKSEPATRSMGFGFLFIVILIFGANEFMLVIFNRYFPIILALSGPFISFGIATVIYPPIFDALFTEKDEGYPKWLRRLSVISLVVGVLISIYIFLKLNFG